MTSGTINELFIHEKTSTKNEIIAAFLKLTNFRFISCCENNSFDQLAISNFPVEIFSSLNFWMDFQEKQVNQNEPIRDVCEITEKFECKLHTWPNFRFLKFFLCLLQLFRTTHFPTTKLLLRDDGGFYSFALWVLIVSEVWF